MAVSQRKAAAALMSVALQKYPEGMSDTDIETHLDALSAGLPTRFDSWPETFGDAYADRDGIDPRTPGEDGLLPPLSANQEARMMRKAVRLFLLDIVRGTRARKAAEQAAEAAREANTEPDEA